MTDLLTVVVSAVLLLAVSVHGQEPTLGVTASNNLDQIHIDGVQQALGPNRGDWYNIDKVPFDNYARLVAVRANNIIGGCSGILVSSFDSLYPFVSDETWKCSASPPNGWQNLTFDDSTWEPALPIVANGDVITGCSLIIIEEMPTTSYWIWTNSFLDGDQIASCRGYTAVCEESPCQNGGTCQINGIDLCSCPVRWTGRFCETEFDECESNPCQNGGQCDLDDFGYNCTCGVGYTGVNCEIDTTDCATQPCENGGTCSFIIDGGYTCACIPGYAGVNCETDVDECGSDPCLNGATCLDGINSATCTCVPGFTGIFCQNNINECLSSPCRNAGTCQDLVNGFECVCHPGWSGTLCDLSVGACESNPCQNNGTCTLSGPGGNIQCICTPGWSGPLCNSNENECLSDPCNNNGTCVDGDGMYECYCQDEFHGDNCETVIPNCGDVLKQSPFSPTNGFTILCQLDISSEDRYKQTPCRELIYGINYYNNSETITRLGGTFGCFVTKFEEDLQSACVPDYRQDVTLASCLSCAAMGVCIRFPN